MAKRLKQHIEINGQNRWVTGYTHQEVLDNAIKLVIAATKAETQEATEKKVTFAAYAKNWLVLYKEHTLKHTTLREYTTLLNKHILPVFGEMNICAITIDEVQRFMNDKASMSRKSIHEMVMVCNTLGIHLAILTSTSVRRIVSTTTWVHIVEPVSFSEQSAETRCPSSCFYRCL